MHQPTRVDPNGKKCQAKNHISKTLQKYQLQKILAEAENKSKVRDLITYRNLKELNTRPNYMNVLTRNNCSNIFNTRARMLQIKGNYKNKYANMNCRWCKQRTETQHHILTSCTKLKHITKNTPYLSYFSNDNNKITQAAATINRIQATLDEDNQTCDAPSQKEVERPGEPGALTTID